jgi:hypothetical protein
MEAAKFCIECGKPLPPKAEYCPNCGAHVVDQHPTPVGDVHHVVPAPPTEKTLPQPAHQQVSPFVQQYATQGSVAKPKKKRSFKDLIALGLVALLICGAVLAYSSHMTDLTNSFIPGLSGAKENIVLGSTQAVVAVDIPATGGKIAVTDPASQIPGLKVSVPSGAYGTKTNFKVSATAIEKHTFGKGFTPITPLITMDNGHGFANQPMTVTIPIKISKDEFAMAFYYDRSNGGLEGIPIVSLSENQIVITTSHFSDMVVSKIQKSELDNIKIDTGFKPGVDDWQFVNNGSYIAQGGQCAGQSITSMWYYYEKYKKAGERRLYGRFDNNDNGTGTIDFDLDDSWSYRYVSVVQKSIGSGISKGLFRKFTGTNDSLTFYAFAYSMLLTSNPQYTAIYRYDQTGKIAGGHALVAYRIEKNIIYVTDPNYPGDATRSIVYDTKTNKFIPYESGENAEEIKKGNSKTYAGIGYCAVSAMIDWNVVGNEYDKMVKGQSGNGVFPKFELYYLTSVDKATGAETYAKCGSGTKISKDETAKISPALKGKLKFKCVGQYTNQHYYVYDGTESLGAVFTPSNGQTYKTINVALNKGVNDLGFYSTVFMSGQDYYVDFKRFKVTYDQNTPNTPISDKWVLDGAPVVTNELHANEDKLIKVGIENGSATYDVQNIGLGDNAGKVIGTTKANFTFTEIPKELIVGSKIEFTVSGQYLGSGNCYDCMFNISSPEIADVEMNSYLSCGIMINDADRKKTLTSSSATIPAKDEFNKGVLHIVCTLNGPAGQQIVTYTYK